MSKYKPKNLRCLTWKIQLIGLIPQLKTLHSHTFSIVMSYILMSRGHRVRGENIKTYHDYLPLPFSCDMYLIKTE